MHFIIVLRHCDENEYIIFSFAMEVQERLCKDITFDECSIDESMIIKPISNIGWINCHSECAEHDRCAFFRYEQSSCLLLSDDYRRTCSIKAGPKVSQIQ